MAPGMLENRLVRGVCELDRRLRGMVRRPPWAKAMMTGRSSEGAQSETRRARTERSDGVACNMVPLKIHF